MKNVTPDYRSALILYLLAKVDAEDWHGVSDAANDLREFDVQERMETEIKRLKAKLAATVANSKPASPL